MGLRRIATIFVLGCIVAGSARADFLGSGSLFTNDIYDGTLTTLQLGLSVGPNLLTGPYLLTGSIGDNSDGVTFSFDHNSTNFGSIAAALTNGVDDHVELAAWINSTPSMNVEDFESTVFASNLPLNAVDFAGKLVTEIRITVSSVSISPSDPQTPVNYSGTIEIYGSSLQSIPSPGTACLGMLGLVCLGGRRW